MSTKYIDVKKDSIKSSELELDFDSKEFNILFYDSIIIKSIHNHSYESNQDRLCFEVLLEYFNQVIVLDFREVVDIISEITLGHFPEIREIKIHSCDGRNLMKCEFILMWGDKTIQFYFESMKMVLYVISDKNTKVPLGCI